MLKTGTSNPARQIQRDLWEGKTQKDVVGGRCVDIDPQLQPGICSADTFRVKDLGLGVEGAGCRIQGVGCRVQGSGFRVKALGCVQG